MLPQPVAFLRVREENRIEGIPEVDSTKTCDQDFTAPGVQWKGPPYVRSYVL